MGKIDPGTGMGWKDGSIRRKPFYTYDQEADALYVLLAPDPQPAVGKTVELGSQLHVDLDSNGTVVGVEILYPSIGIPDLGPLKERFDLELQLPFSFAA